MKVKMMISNIEPVKKFWGMMWLDTGNNNILKIYNGIEWLVVHFE